MYPEHKSSYEGFEHWASDNLTNVFNSATGQRSGCFSVFGCHSVLKLKLSFMGRRRA